MEEEIDQEQVSIEKKRIIDNYHDERDLDVHLAMNLLKLDKHVMSVQSLNNQIRQNKFVLYNLPVEQHWVDKQKSNYIEQTLIGIPINPIYGYLEDNKILIFMGYNRITSLVDFLQDKFSLKGMSILLGIQNLKFSLIKTDKKKFFRNSKLELFVARNAHDDLMKFFKSSVRKNDY